MKERGGSVVSVARTAEEKEGLILEKYRIRKQNLCTRYRLVNIGPYQLVTFDWRARGPTEGRGKEMISTSRDNTTRDVGKRDTK